MDKTYSLENLDIPSYIEDRINLDDPSEASFIDDLAAAVESDLTVINGIVAFESLDESPFTLAHTSSMFGLEANKYVEAAKQTYYKLKQRAKQFIKYVFGFFLNFLRGSVDAKAVIEKYSKKLKSYKKAFEKMRRTDNTEKDIEIRDVKTRIITSVSMILVLTQGLDSLMNAMYKESESNVESKILAFAISINHINHALVAKEYPSKELESELEKAGGDVGKLTSMQEVNKLITEIFKKLKSGAKEIEQKFKLENDNNNGVKEALKEAKEMYKEKVESDKYNHADAYDYMKKTLNVLEALIDPKKNNWDFKKVARKVEKIDRTLTKEIERLGSEEEEKMATKNKSTGNAIKTVMDAGSYMATSKSIVSTALKTFKGDMEIFFTECSKVGSILHKKQ